MKFKNDSLNVQWSLECLIKVSQDTAIHQSELPRPKSKNLNRKSHKSVTTSE